MTSRAIEKSKVQSASSLLAGFINTGGEKVSYQDIEKAVKRERLLAKIRTLTTKYKVAAPLIIIGFIVISVLSKED